MSCHTRISIPFDVGNPLLPLKVGIPNPYILAFELLILLLVSKLVRLKLVSHRYR